MRNFLTNLVGRSLGTLEVVQPRVPSIFEPYRRGTGLLGANPGLPLRDARFEPHVRAGLEGEGNAVSDKHQTPKSRASPAHPAVRDAQQAKHEPEADVAKVSEADPEPVEAPARPGPSAQAPASLMPRSIARPQPAAAIPVPTRHDLISPPSAPPVSPPAPIELSASGANTHPDGNSLIAAPLGDLGGNGPEGGHSLAQSQVVAKPGPVRSPRPPEMRAEAPNSRMELSELPALRATLEPSLVAHPIPPGIGAVRPPITLSTAGHQEPHAASATQSPIRKSPGHQESSATSARRTAIAPSAAAGHQEPPHASEVRPPVTSTLAPQQALHVTSAVRPPVPPHPINAKSPEALPPSSPSPPAIEVSIGRVEVRAVFPEQAVRSAPAPRPKTTVSLDDFLQRRHRRGER
jgi:hypothetical protein